METVRIGQTYRHYKGTLYKVLGIARHSETQEELVIYTDGGKLWARPKGMFLESVESGGKKIKRFTLIKE